MPAVVAAQSTRRAQFSPATRQPESPRGVSPPVYCAITFVDPVSLLDENGKVLYPGLQTGNGITSNSALLGTSGRVVTAIAADSAARVVLRIPAQYVGQNFNLTLVDDHGNTAPASNVGSLSSIGGAQNSSAVTVTATNAGGTPMAFAVYSAPTDFVRIDSGTLDPQDLGDSVRAIVFTAADVNSPSNTVLGTVNVIRPPVVLVHGFGDSPSLWRYFLVGDSRFFKVLRYDYNMAAQISQNGTVPSYPLSTLANANANQLGLAYNAPLLLSKLVNAIRELRQANGAAAAQADVIGHSLGGLIARWAETLPQYGDQGSFGVGRIHKLITVGTPHFGSPFATALLQPQNQCLENMMVARGALIFGATVALTSGATVSGAVYDLQGDANGIGAIAGLSPVLGKLENGFGPTPPAQHVPMAMVAGAMTPTNLATVSGAIVPMVWARCFLTQNPPLAGNLTSTGWPSIFNGNDSDAIVAVTSQTQLTAPFPPGQFPDSIDWFSGVVHSDGLIVTIAVIGNVLFTGPAELDICAPNSSCVASLIPPHLVVLLNTPSQFLYYH
jgi:pimeloyl-ACP methyl ester carboxylesterase